MDKDIKKEDRIQVLVVEDNPGDRVLLCEQLERIAWIDGFLLAENLAEALSRLQSDPVDVIIATGCDDAIFDDQRAG